MNTLQRTPSAAAASQTFLGEPISSALSLTLKLEELAMFAFSILAFNFLPFAWWFYPILLLAPDIAMIGYLANPRVGAFLYNLFHHKGFALVVWIFGFALGYPALQLAGVILFGHSAMDRIAGYGLKYAHSFQATHLGTLKIPTTGERNIK